MSDLTMGVIESRFADIIWQNEPIASSELCKLSEQTLGWKKSTTFTVLKRLCAKGIFENSSGRVTSVISREQFYAAQSEQFVNDTFGGSLPKFLAAFCARKALSPDEVAQLRKMIEEYEEAEQ